VYTIIEQTLPSPHTTCIPLRPSTHPSSLFLLVSQEDSSPDYLVKAEDCLRDEEERVNSYLHVSTKPKLLKEVGEGEQGVQ
jgi:hypothetical protein